MIPHNIIFLQVYIIFTTILIIYHFFFTEKIHKSGKNYFCRDHILPRCGEYEVPCFHCTCLLCKKLYAMSRCKICIPENYTPNLDNFYDPARDVKSLNKRFKKHVSTDFSMYFLFLDNVLSYIFVL